MGVKLCEKVWKTSGMLVENAFRPTSATTQGPNPLRCISSIAGLLDMVL